MSFTGRAIYDAGVFDATQDDVSPIIGRIAPFDTPLLDAMGDPPFPARNVLHEWIEDDLSPNTFISSATIPASTTTTSIAVAGGLARYIQPGAIVWNEAAGEYLRVSARDLANNALTLVRAIGGTSAASVGAGATFRVMDGAALEGESVSTDISRARTRRGNLCQIIKKDIVISGTMQAVAQHGLESEYRYQLLARSREALRDLEKFVVCGKGTTASTLGSAGVPRMMHGIVDLLATNVTTVSTFDETAMREALASCFDAGGNVDLILCDRNFKEVVDQLNASRVGVSNRDTRFSNLVTVYEGTYGVQRVILSRWMPANSALFLDTSRIKVLPLVGRSFFNRREESSVDAVKGAVIGEYTLELKNESGMARVYVPAE
ncbi:MAG: DUF5309 family protein [Planctomycetota bacterium]